MSRREKEKNMAKRICYDYLWLGRIPLPKKSGGPLTTKKGKKGYNRRRLQLTDEYKEDWTLLKRRKRL
tara:strand:+ start:2609 stop:2812 length:204 start_codon:yes stop_codon:yes gene_type:complete